MAEHTKLPWLAVSEYEGEPATFIDVGGRAIADCAHGYGSEDVANAAFIVRAVNSHEALVKALEFIRDGYERGDVSHETFRVKAAQAAADALAAVGGVPK